ncbi:MAG: DsbA family protein [Devosiaceae bacterium]|nr:DsbA family protein [Devosiaceae bacterium MH13]
MTDRLLNRLTDRLDRRRLLKSSALLAVAGTALAACNDSSTATAPDGTTRAVPEGGEDTVDLAALLSPTDGLPDITLGDPDAPVVIVDYSSMTCPHCARFHTAALPAIKENYIDQGNAYYVFREFPLDARARAASMLARCADDALYHDVIDILFERQREWAAAGNPAEALFDIVGQAGYTQETFNACLTNRDLEQAIVAGAERGSSEFGVASTPTIFINGARFPGARSAQEYAEIIDPLLG